MDVFWLNAVDADSMELPTLSQGNNVTFDYIKREIREKKWIRNLVKGLYEQCMYLSSSSFCVHS